MHVHEIVQARVEEMQKSLKLLQNTFVLSTVGHSSDTYTYDMHLVAGAKGGLSFCVCA